MRQKESQLKWAKTNTIARPNPSFLILSLRFHLPSHGLPLFNTRDVRSSGHRARGQGCRERQNTTVRAGVFPFQLVDLELSPLLKQPITTSSGLSLGHLFRRTLLCSFVHMLLFLSGALL